MKYMCLIYQDEKGAMNEAERQQCYRDSTDYAHQLAERGKFLAASPLHPTSTATSIRIRDGKPMFTDGPFAETREQLGGYFLIEAKDLDDALAIGSAIPAGKFGTVEVRPVVEIEGLPEN